MSHKAARHWDNAEGFIDDRVMYEPMTGCWLWVAASNGAYGKFIYDWKTVYAHRFAYRAFVGEIPEDFDIDHLCRQTFCVNPQHLEAVPHRTNVLRGVGIMAEFARRTHCVNGHLLDDSVRKSDGSRKCRECERERDRKRGWRRPHHERRRAEREAKSA